MASAGFEVSCAEMRPNHSQARAVWRASSHRAAHADVLAASHVASDDASDDLWSCEADRWMTPQLTARPAPDRDLHLHEVDGTFAHKMTSAWIPAAVGECVWHAWLCPLPNIICRLPSFDFMSGSVSSSRCGVVWPRWLWRSITQRHERIPGRLDIASSCA